MFSPKVCVIKMRKVLTGPNPETSLETHNGGKREVPTGPNSGASPSTSSKAVLDPPWYLFKTHSRNKSDQELIYIYIYKEIYNMFLRPKQKL
jgi:hypothetical protein